MTGTAVMQLALRITGRILATIGLVALYGSIAVAIAFGFSWVDVWIWMAALTAATAGCLCLIGFLAQPSAEKGKVTGEATLGFFALPPGVFALVANLWLGDGSSLHLSWLLFTMFLLPASITLIGLSARARQAMERWRNTGEEI